MVDRIGITLPVPKKINSTDFKSSVLAIDHNCRIGNIFVKDKPVFFVILYERVQLIAENYIKNDFRNNKSAVLLAKDIFNKTIHMDII
jgi:hypothetical protein